MNGVELTPDEEILDRLDRTLRASPADRTEIVWIETARAGARSAGGGAEAPPAAAPRRERTVLVRVHERGRNGFHRTGAGTVGELESAVRQALGQARTDPWRGPSRPLADGSDALPALDGLHDPAIAALDPAQAAALLAEGLEAGDRAALDWAEARVAVGNSLGLRRLARTTAATLTVTAGRGPGAGRAAGSARTLAALGAEAVRDRARARRAAANGGEPQAAPDPGPGAPALVLAPEAAVRLIEVLARQALIPPAADGGGFARPVTAPPGVAEPLRLDPGLELRDDPTDPRGLPFPFDLHGFAARSVELIAGGRPVAAGPESPDAGERAGDHLFVRPGGLAEAELAAAAGDGLWLGWIERVECWDPPELAFRARLRGVRRIAGGILSEPLGDLVWEDRLPRALGRLLGIGDTAVRLVTGDGALGGIAAPALALAPGEAAVLSPAID